MFKVSRFAKSSLFLLLTATLTTATLTTAAYARGGGHSDSNRSNGSNGFKGASQPVESSTAIVSRHGGKTLPNGSVALTGRHPYNDPPIVRDHRGSVDSIGNTLGGPCNNGCVGQGGFKGDTQPAQNQDHSTGSGTAKVTDHRTGH